MNDLNIGNIEFPEEYLRLVRDVSIANTNAHIKWNHYKLLSKISPDTSDKQAIEWLIDLQDTHNGCVRNALECGCEAELCDLLSSILILDMPFFRLENHYIVFDSMVYSVCGVE